MNELRWTLKIQPRPKERPRMARNGKVFTPQATAEYERTLAMMLGRPLLSPLAYHAPVSIDVRFYLEPPKSKDVRRFHTSRPDVDNLLKSVLDALILARILEDDSCVHCVRATKAYANHGCARIELDLSWFDEPATDKKQQTTDQKPSAVRTGLLRRASGNRGVSGRSNSRKSRG